MLIRLTFTLARLVSAQWYLKRDTKRQRARGHLVHFLEAPRVSFVATFQSAHQSGLNGMGFAVVFPIYSALVGNKVRKFMEEFQQVPEIKGKVPT